VARAFSRYHGDIANVAVVVQAANRGRIVVGHVIPRPAVPIGGWGIAGSISDNGALHFLDAALGELPHEVVKAILIKKWISTSA